MHNNTLESFNCMYVAQIINVYNNYMYVRDKMYVNHFSSCSLGICNYIYVHMYIRSYTASYTMHII